MSLKKKALGGLAWTFTQQFSTQIINFIVSIVLARILAPAEFGLIGMLSIFMGLGRTLMDGGLTSSLIRTPNADQKDYSTVFFINLTGSVIIYIILFFAAPFIASFYKQEILASIVRVYALSFIIQAFVGVQRTRLTKEMNFKTQLTIQIPSLVAGGVIGIVLAKLGYGVWSLVWMGLFQSLISTIQHWIYSGWRPNFMFDRERFKYHFNFGYKMTIANLIESLYSNMYTLIIGRYFSASQVGFYTRALALRQLPVANIANAIDKVSYPMLSSINNDDVKLKMAYKKVMQQLVFWLTPLLILLVILAEPFITILLTEKWLPSVPFFQVLCIGGIMYPINRYNVNILKVKGRSDLKMKLEMIKKTYSLAAVFLAVQYGVMGLLYCQLILEIVEYFLNSSFSGKLIDYKMKEQLKDLVPTIALAGFIGILSAFFDSWLVNQYNMSDLGRLVIVGSSFLLAYLGLSSLTKFPAMLEFRQLIINR